MSLLLNFVGVCIGAMTALAADFMGAPGLAMATGITISSGRRVPWLWLNLLPVTILYFV